MEVIHIYHTNDLHSHFENWPRIFEFLQNRRNWHKEAGESVYLFDVGDHVDLSHPYTEATKGKINTTLLEKGKYDAVTIGNNEGITLSYDALDHLYDEASFDILVANLFNGNGERPSWCKPHQIYETKNGIKIGVFGVTAFFQKLYELLGWNLSDPLESIQEQVDNLSKEVDIIVLLSHLGINDDEWIGNNIPEIDIVLGAHTHHIFHEGKVIENSLQGAAGKFGYYVGHIELVVDIDCKKIVQKKARLYDTSELPEATQEKTIIENFYLQGKNALSKVACTIDQDIPSRTLATMLCETLVTWCDSDCAIINEGLILHNLAKGDVTHFDLLSICPHPINPCNVTLTGAELKEVLLDMNNKKWQEMQVKGLGFRGTLMGSMVMQGVTNHKAGKLETYFIQNEEIQADKEYIVTVPDMFTFGHFFPSIYRAENKKYFLPEFMRNILLETLVSRVNV